MAKKRRLGRMHLLWFDTTHIGPTRVLRWTCTYYAVRSVNGYAKAYGSSPIEALEKFKKKFPRQFEHHLKRAKEVASRQ